MTFDCQDKTLLDDWLTAGPSSRVEHATARTPYTTRLLGTEIALWRDAAGQVHGRAGAAPLLVLEAYGYLWVCPSGQPRKALFAFPEFSQDGRRIVDCDGIGVSVSGLRMVENFLDMGHFPYVHASYLGEVPQTEVAKYDVSVDESADEIWATNCRFYQPRTSKAATTGLEVQYAYRVMQPMSAMLYKTAFPRPGEMDAIGLFVQPHDEDHITAYCLLSYFDDTSTETDLIAFQHTIFGQDKPILESQVPKRMPLQLGAEMPTRCDAMSVAYRRWLSTRGTSYGTVR
ncbi:aromatic ring-hydroxylating dioxygenase subunit alpha [Pelomonas sp. KK5]|uniref:aromatic ring-hydroxylating oxygenase subunit alpha n=1 Tax=Pelomonas sp. KK5 TaxID=1855730 RepID=UPI00097BC18E|nr:aromatic ring-hydroxylating dioxygenase subunit alpha [Pelomonas sp. KK5]